MTKKNGSCKLIDMNIMHTVFGENTEAIREYIELYIKHTHEIIGSIKIALENKDNEIIMKYFHQLKGSSGSSGFNKIYHLCEKGEKNTVSFDWKVVTECCVEIEELLKKIEDECLKKFKKS